MQAAVGRTDVQCSKPNVDYTGEENGNKITKGK
jgi:hypothetical protein